MEDLQNKSLDSHPFSPEHKIRMSYDTYSSYIRKVGMFEVLMNRHDSRLRGKLSSWTRG